ncbi:MAG: hypothetical protein SF162_05670 [bacterium]|nr:hypothetical protein [bacterium]
MQRNRISTIGWMMAAVPPTAVPTEKAQVRAIRAAARRAIWLPFGLGLLAILLLSLATLTFPDVRQIDLVANFLLVFVLCPAILCLFPVYLLFVLAVYGMGRLNQGVSKPLMRVERLTASADERVTGISARLAKASITFNARLAYIDRAVFSIFDERPENRETTHGHSADEEQPRG